MKVCFMVQGMISVRLIKVIKFFINTVENSYKYYFKRFTGTINLLKNVQIFPKSLFWFCDFQIS